MILRQGMRMPGGGDFKSAEGTRPLMSPTGQRLAASGWPPDLAQMIT